MRSAGVAVNDVADRTSTRMWHALDAAARRRLGQPQEALILAVVLALIAFLLILSLGKLVILLSFCAFFLAVTYPFTSASSCSAGLSSVAFGFGIPWPTRRRPRACPAGVGAAARNGSGPSPTTPSTQWSTAMTIAASAFGPRASLRSPRRCGGCAVPCHLLALMGWIGWRLHLNWPDFGGLVCGCAGCLSVRPHPRRAPQKCFRAFSTTLDRRRRVHRHRARIPAATHLPG